MSIARDQAARRLHLGQMLNNSRPFHKNLAVIQHQHRHITVRIDRKKILPVAGPVRSTIDLDDTDIKIKFSGNDVRRGGSVCLNSFMPIAKWFPALFMPRVELSAAG
jgi:hypothetical protein